MVETACSPAKKASFVPKNSGLIQPRTVTSDTEGIVSYSSLSGSAGSLIALHKQPCRRGHRHGSWPRSNPATSRSTCNSRLATSPARRRMRTASRSTSQLRRGTQRSARMPTPSTHRSTALLRRTTQTSVPSTSIIRSARTASEAPRLSESVDEPNNGCVDEPEILYFVATRCVFVGESSGRSENREA